MNELVSIVMPSYNTAKYIGASIRSVLAQSYSNWELIIVDDCSTDDTDNVIKQYLTDNRIRFLKNEKNSGAAVSRNRALREAKGKWIAFLDSDDLWEPDKLERQIAFMNETGYKFTYTDYKIQLNGEMLPYIYTGPNKVTEHKLKNYCYFSTITVMYDREYIGLVQTADIKKNNDYALWLKVIKNSPCYRFPVCLSYYIKHDNSISSGSKIKLIRHHYILWTAAEGKSPLVALLYTIRNLFWGVLKKIFYRTKINNK